MARKQKIEYEYKCEACGYLQEPDKEKSTDNWTVYPTICSKCGGRVKVSIL